MDKITITDDHSYIFNGYKYPSVTTLLSHFGMCPNYDSFGTDYSRSLGAVLHETCALLDEDNLGGYDSAIEGRLNGYKKFLHAYKPVWETIECPFVSIIWRFAGTPDRYGIINKRPAVIDIKSGAPDESHSLQTAGYEILLDEHYCKKITRYALYLTDNDYKIIQHNVSTDKSVFLGLVQAYNWKLTHNKIKEPLWQNQN